MEVRLIPGYALFQWEGATALLVKRDTPEPPSLDTFALLDTSDNAAVLEEIVQVSSGTLSPEGDWLAYYRPLGAECEPGCASGLVLRELATGDEFQFGEFSPKVLIDTALLVVESDNPPEALRNLRGTSLLDATTGVITAAPELNGFNQVWPATREATLVGLGSGDRFPPWLSIVDLDNGGVTQIEESAISFPSDHIPTQHVTSTVNHVYWFDATGQDAPWFRANYDGSGLTKLGDADSYFLQFSPSVSYVAYIKPGPPEVGQPLVIATIDGEEVIDLGPSGNAAAWRPLSE